MNEEQNKTLEELRKFRFNWKPISRPPKNRKAKRYPRNKDILKSRELIQITDDIWNTVNDLIDRINPTNNSRLGAILLTLEGAKSIAREFYPHTLEYDKQRPDRIPPHILTRTATLFPNLTGRELVKEQKKQRNIYNNFLDNTQAQIEGIKKRLLAESPEFCKIFEENPETEETEFYYGDNNNQFTILPFRFHHLILHHLEAIDNILYSEGARNKIYFEEEESYISAYTEINKLSQEFLDQAKKVKELKKEKRKA
ncbi:7603_t:CDS:1 [Paraglomus brasilianum]|uniref:7603_t:CDS:1 n=1 Tax=Paraglomus brasilianum TaxID=144538 RepID=A0A9N9H5P0_9GLOM|nr:7603_t:CDS:1 [Paraglomus brasilianum]